MIWFIRGVVLSSALSGWTEQLVLWSLWTISAVFDNWFRRYFKECSIQVVVLCRCVCVEWEILLIPLKLTMLLILLVLVLLVQVIYVNAQVLHSNGILHQLLLNVRYSLIEPLGSSPTIIKRHILLTSIKAIVYRRGLSAVLGHDDWVLVCKFRTVQHLGLYLYVILWFTAAVLLDVGVVMILSRALGREVKVKVIRDNGLVVDVELKDIVVSEVLSSIQIRGCLLVRLPLSWLVLGCALLSPRHTPSPSFFAWSIRIVVDN